MKLKGLKSFFVTFLFLTLIFPSSFVYSVDPECNPADGKICNPVPPWDTLNGFIKNLLTGALKIGFPLIALAIIYCGFLFVAARGNSEKLTKAKDALLHTLLGAAILLGAWAIAQVISETVFSLG